MYLYTNFDLLMLYMYMYDGSCPWVKVDILVVLINQKYYLLLRGVTFFKPDINSVHIAKRWEILIWHVSDLQLALEPLSLGKNTVCKDFSYGFYHTDNL